MLYPLLGEPLRGWPGHAVDVLCTAGTLFGVAVSLGLDIQEKGGTPLEEVRKRYEHEEKPARRKSSKSARRTR